MYLQPLLSKVRAREVHKVYLEPSFLEAECRQATELEMTSSAFYFAEVWKSAVRLQ